MAIVDIASTKHSGRYQASDVPLLRRYGNATIVLEPDKSYFVEAAEVDTIKMADFSLNVGDVTVLPVAVNTSFLFNGFSILLTYDPDIVEVLQGLPSSSISASKFG